MPIALRCASDRTRRSGIVLGTRQRASEHYPVNRGIRPLLSSLCGEARRKDDATEFVSHDGQVCAVQHLLDVLDLWHQPRRMRSSPAMTVRDFEIDTNRCFMYGSLPHKRVPFSDRLLLHHASTSVPIGVVPAPERLFPRSDELGKHRFFVVHGGGGERLTSRTLLTAGSWHS